MRLLTLVSLQTLLVSGYCFSQEIKSPVAKPSSAETFVGFGEVCFKSIKAKPLKEGIRKYKNRHSDSDFDEWYTRDYPHLQIVAVRPIGAAPELLRKVTFSDPKTTLPLGISLGDTAAKVLGILGKPSARKPGSISYEVGDLLSESATLFFKNDRLVRIEWDYEID